MKRIFVCIVLLSGLVTAAEEVTLSEYIDQFDQHLNDVIDVQLDSLVQTSGQSLSELIDGQDFEAIVYDVDSLTTSDLADVAEITLEHSFINTMAYEGRDRSEFAHQASTNAKTNSCNQSKDENTVCTSVVCAFGLAFGEWSSECTENVLDMALLRVKTPPWESLPQCFMVDEHCSKAGKASPRALDNDFCDELESAEKRHACLLGLEISDEEKALAYIERNNGDAELLELTEFERPQRTDEVEQEPQDYSSTFLATQVDPRYAQEHELFEPNGADGPGHALGHYIAARDNGVFVGNTRRELIQSGALRAVCADVPVEQFYNCNQFPDLPEQCWSSKNHESIVECVRHSNGSS